MVHVAEMWAAAGVFVAVRRDRALRYILLQISRAPAAPAR
jgi:hypothetical protein